MKTFNEFILERYYEPDEPLPSGKTPYGKATSSYYRQKGELKRSPNRTSDQFFKLINQGSRRKDEVSHGADNPEFKSKPDPSGRYDIDADSDYRLKVRDTKNNTQMQVRRKDQFGPGGKPVYDVEWYNTGRSRDGKQYNPGEARGITRDVGRMFRNQISPRLPSNSILTNFPVTNDTSERNTRSKLYSKVAGFGKVGMQGRQYAAVGRPVSSRQAAKGIQRTTPLSGDLDPNYATGDDMRKRIEKYQKPAKYYGNQTKETGKPRTISPAKPSSPSINRVMKALKSTPAIKAPGIPKPPTFKMPNIRVRGGGRAALAAGVVAAGLGAYAALNKPKK